MEDLSHDPEFAQELVKLLNARLKVAKHDLEDARRVSNFLSSNKNLWKGYLTPSLQENDQLKAKLCQTGMNGDGMQVDRPLSLEPVSDTSYELCSRRYIAH